MKVPAFRTAHAVATTEPAPPVVSDVNPAGTALTACWKLLFKKLTTRHRTVVVIDPVVGVVVATPPATPLLAWAAAVLTPENSAIASSRDAVETECVAVTVSAPALPDAAQAMRAAWTFVASLWTGSATSVLPRLSANDVEAAEVESHDTNASSSLPDTTALV